MMRLNRLANYTLVLCIISWILIISPLDCFAWNTEFETADISEEEIADIYSRLNLELINEPEVKYGFSCFDVNQFGDYALGFDGSEKDTILVYDSNGDYKYGFLFVDGGDFGVGWYANEVILYRVRSDLAILINDQGKCLGIKEIQNTLDNSHIWTNEVDANKRIKEDATYTAEHWLFNSELLHWGTYTRLVKTMPDGERIVLFDTTDDTLSRMIALTVFVGIVCISIFVLILYHLKRGDKAHRKT